MKLKNALQIPGKGGVNVSKSPIKIFFSSERIAYIYFNNRFKTSL
jgi:hypothetical protein